MAAERIQAPGRSLILVGTVGWLIIAKIKQFQARDVQLQYLPENVDSYSQNVNNYHSTVSTSTSFTNIQTVYIFLGFLGTAILFIQWIYEYI
jgi:hypothetical protein